MKKSSRQNISIYNNQGALFAECKIGDEITLAPDFEIKFNEFITSTGLQIKSDPGIPIVYTSFFLLMCSVYLSFISYSQIWQIEDGLKLVIGGKSNRAVLYFQQEFRKIIRTFNS